MIQVKHLMIYKIMQVFSTIPTTTSSIFCFQPITKQFIYYLATKANNSEQEMHEKQELKALQYLGKNTQQI